MFDSKNKDTYFLFLIIKFALASLAFGDPNSTLFNRESFPPSFLLGSASCAYQYEGATAEDGRAPCLWDTFVQKFPNLIEDHSNTDVNGVDQYHRYKEDIALSKDIGFNTYRLSISWSRVLPSGRLSGGVNQAGIDYYNNLINELVSNGITPFVTLFHWDLPQALEDVYEGFLSPRIIDDFRDFAGLCFSKFGDRVKHWLTFNEPLTYITSAYQSGIFPPNRCSDRATCAAGDSTTEPYIVAHHWLLAHAAAVNLYRQTYQSDQKGQIGIALNGAWMIPYSDSIQDKLAAERSLTYQFGWFMEPMLYGSYPKLMIENVGTRLPKFTPEESNLVKGSYDLIGINYYTSRYAQHIPCQDNTTRACENVTAERNGIPIGPQIGPWLYVYPQGIQDLLLYFKDKYNDPILYITENGVSDNMTEATEGTVNLEDKLRIDYYYNHLGHVHKAIWQGAKVRGFMAWALLDNWEWRSGYKFRAGVIYVDYKNGSKRIPKQSYYWFKNFINPKNATTPPSTMN